MKIDEILQIGTFHTNHCEDDLIYAEIEKNKWLFAVMDGCTMGTDSHFAATLMAKILRKNAKNQYFKSFVQPTEESLVSILEKATQQLFEELTFYKNQLQLEREELLATLVLAIIDSDKKTAEILVIGDGLVSSNDTLFEFEQENVPDYLGYHLTENFETFYRQQKQRLSLKNLNNLCLSTDGIFTFQKFNTDKYSPLNSSEIIHFLFQKSPKSLRKKLLQIEEKHGLKPTDDLGIIQITF